MTAYESTLGLPAGSCHAMRTELSLVAADVSASGASGVASRKAGGIAARADAEPPPPAGPDGETCARALVGTQFGTGLFLACMHRTHTLLHNTLTHAQAQPNRCTRKTPLSHTQPRTVNACGLPGLQVVEGGAQLVVFPPHTQANRHPKPRTVNAYVWPGCRLSKVVRSWSSTVLVATVRPLPSLAATVKDEMQPPSVGGSHTTWGRGARVGVCACAAARGGGRLRARTRSN